MMNETSLMGSLKSEPHQSQQTSSYFSCRSKREKKEHDIAIQALKKLTSQKKPQNFAKKRKSYRSMGSSLWKKRLLGLFLLALQATAWLNGVQPVQNVQFSIKLNHPSREEVLFKASLAEKIQIRPFNKGASPSELIYSNLLSSLPLPDTPELTPPLAIRKKDSKETSRNSILRTTGVLRERLGYLTGLYLDQQLKITPISTLQGFNIPLTIIQTEFNVNFKDELLATPVSVVRFVSPSLSLLETSPAEIPEEEWTKLFILDVILGNTDRHSGNLLVQDCLDKEGRPVRRLIPIDHDLILPDLSSNEFRWTYHTSENALSLEWQSFIEQLDADTLWKLYSDEAAVFSQTYAVYTKGNTGIHDATYLNFRARIKILQEGAKRGWSPNRISELFSQIKYEDFFINDNPNETREQRQSRIFANIDAYFKTKYRIKGSKQQEIKDKS